MPKYHRPTTRAAALTALAEAGLTADDFSLGQPRLDGVFMGLADKGGSE